MLAGLERRDTQRLSVFLDLGDAFTKSIAVGNVRHDRMRFPSVVASRLMSGGSEMTELMLDRRDSIQRPLAFEPELYPRTRSYPRGAELVRRVRECPPASGARFAGRIAAMYGA